MGTSTAAQLIAKGQAENAYNNSGISTPNQWLDFFNDALRDLVDDINIEKTFTDGIVYNGTTREYNLPADYFSLIVLNYANGNRVDKRRSYDNQTFGYWIMYRGSKYVIDFYKNGFAQTFTGLYIAYPATLTATDQVPDVPGIGERALIYYALAKALRNNNQVGQAQEMEAKYEAERKKIRTAAAMARGA